MLKVTEVQIIPIKPKDGLIAFASVVIDNNLYLSSIGIHTKLGGGYRLTYPTRQVGDRDLNVYHPINKLTSEAIEQAVFDRLKEVMKANNDRHNSFDAETK